MPAAPEIRIVLRIQITKRADGGGLLRCVRPDGSVTWQKQKDRHAAFFALHDLTHFAVESTLGVRRGFFGLISDGWDIEDTTGKGARGRLPLEALEVEHIVGAFDTERATGTMLTADDLNEYMAVLAKPSGGTAPRRLLPEEILQIRTKRGQLFAQWFALVPGEAMELHFS
jgi:hypothetical protein